MNPEMYPNAAIATPPFLLTILLPTTLPVHAARLLPETKATSMKATVNISSSSNNQSS